MDCFIYGCGCLYNRILPVIRMCDEINVLGVVTTDKPETPAIDGFKRLQANETDWESADLVIIAIEDWREVFNELSRSGLPDEKIMLGKVFELPYFDLNEYMQVKYCRPSIISNSCLGGRVYKEMGLKALTPCVNAICFDDDSYIRFIKNLSIYKDVDIRPLKSNINERFAGTYNREYFIPKGIVGDEIIWHFPHDDMDKAIYNWNRRKSRINESNLFYLMIAFSDEGAYAFDRLDTEKKICFYYRDLGLKSVVYTPEWNNIDVQRNYDYNYVMFVHRYATNMEGRTRMNWISFLNGKKSFLRW